MVLTGGRAGRDLQAGRLQWPVRVTKSPLNRHFVTYLPKLAIPKSHYAKPSTCLRFPASHNGGRTSV